MVSLMHKIHHETGSRRLSFWHLRCVCNRKDWSTFFRHLKKILSKYRFFFSNWTPYLVLLRISQHFNLHFVYCNHVWSYIIKSLVFNCSGLINNELHNIGKIVHLKHSWKIRLQYCPWQKETFSHFLTKWKEPALPYFLQLVTTSIQQGYKGCFIFTATARVL